MKFRIINIGFIGMLLFAAAARAADTEVSLKDSRLVSLDRAIEMANQYNLDIRQAHSERQVTENKLREAKAASGFSLGFSGNILKTIGRDISFTSVTYDPAGFAAVSQTPGGATAPALVASGMPTLMSFPLIKRRQDGFSFVAKKAVWTFGRIRNNIRENRMGLESSDLDERRVRLDVSMRVKQAYYQYLLALEFKDVADKTLKQAQAHYDAARERFKAGASPRFDIIRAEVDVASAKENLAKALKSVELARMALNNVIGLDVSAPTRVVKPDSSEVVSSSVEALVAAALKTRPELKQIQLGQSRATLGAHMARLLPTIGFQGTYTFRNRGSTFGQEDTWQLVLAADIPVFDSGAARARTSQALRTREKLRQAEQQARDGITLQVHEAYLSMTEAKARVDTSAAILAEAQEAVLMAQLGYKEGVVSNLDVLDAQHGMNGASLNNAQAKFDYEISKAKLLNAVGVENIAQLEK